MRGLLLLAMSLALAGCGGRNPVMTPVGWWHDLQGGEIAATRPPPPGDNLPYPHVFTTPARPTPPSAAFRQTVQTELTEDRDSTERLAARTPIDLADTPPPPPRPAAPDAAAQAETANAILPGADAKPLQAPAPHAAHVPMGPPPEAPVTLAGIPSDDSQLPGIPDAPPPPPGFENIAPAPAPPLPDLARASPSAGGARVLFATGSADLDPSQIAIVRDVAFRRGKRDIDVQGHGEAAGDTPGAQQDAVELGLQRAGAIARALAELHVPADHIRLGATAFGRDATVKLQ